MSKSVYVRVFYHLELLRYVLRCANERQLLFHAGMNKVYCYCCYRLHSSCLAEFLILQLLLSYTVSVKIIVFVARKTTNTTFF